MKRCTVVIVEDHILIAQAIKGLVNSFDNYYVSYICSNGKELLTRIKAGEPLPDVILMDVNMPVLNGIETTRLLKVLYPDLKIIALTVDADETSVVNMFKAGACAYLLKDVEKKILETALKEVIENGCYCTKKVSNILVKSINRNGFSKSALKKRELDFIKHACTEMTYSEIAKKMYLSPKTIEGYRSNLFNKLHVKNRTGLVLYAIKNKIFVP